MVSEANIQMHNGLNKDAVYTWSQSYLFSVSGQSDIWGRRMWENYEMGNITSIVVFSITVKCEQFRNFVILTEPFVQFRFNSSVHKSFEFIILFLSHGAERNNMKSFETSKYSKQYRDDNVVRNNRLMERMESSEWMLRRHRFHLSLRVCVSCTIFSCFF